jgi:hypothetical protein
MKNRIKQTVSFVLAFSLLCAYGPVALSQTTTSGAVEGRVYEEGTSLGVSGATVTIVNQETGLTRTTATGADGRYFIATLPPGFYRISATAPGFEAGANASASNFPISITETKKVQPPPIGLRRIGATPTTGTQPPPTGQTGRPPQTGQTATTGPQTGPQPGDVSDTEQLVNTNNASRGGSVERRAIITLPLPGVRTFDDLAFLFPGVFLPPQAIGTNVGPGIGPGVGTTGQFSVNGMRSRSNNFTMDGSDNNDEEVGVRRQGFTSLVPQSIESIQEFQIITLLPEPQFGRNMGAQVNAVSRLGGIGYHGTLYGFITDRRLKARDPFDLAGGPASFPLRANGQNVLLDGEEVIRPNPVDGENRFTRAQYGVVFGGPIVKQKTHFFFSFEHQDINASRESHFAVPTVEERGLFGTGATGLVATVPVDGQVFTVPIFPSTFEGGAFFALFPFPNNPLGPYGRNTFTEILPAKADGNIASFRLDQQSFRLFGEEHNFSARYNFTDDDTIIPVTGEAIYSSLRPMVRTHNLSLILDSTLSMRSTNQLRFSFGRTDLQFDEVRNPALIPSRRLPNEPFLLNAPLIGNTTLVNLNTGRSVPSFTTFCAPRGFNPGVDRFETPLAVIFPCNSPGAGVPLDTEFNTGPLGQVRVSGFSPLGVDVFNFPQGRTNNAFQIADTFFYTRNDHRLTLGFDTRRLQLNSFLNRNFRPLATFSGARDLSGISFLFLGENGGFLQGTDFVAAGAATGFFQTQADVPDSTIGLRYWQNSFFVSDQIRVRPNFTLTLGARYELNTVPTEVNNRIENTFDSEAVRRFINFERDITEAVLGRPLSGFEFFLAGRDKIFERDNNNIAPHIAFAWDPFGDARTSIRAGYGIYYDQIPGAVISQSRNVFPTFLTFNTGGSLIDPDDPGPQQLLALNPAFTTGRSLNVFNRARAREFFGTDDPALISLLISRSTGFSGGPGFVLPAADLVTPYGQHWSLTIEREFGRDFLASAAYVGTKGTHLLRFATPNLGPNTIPAVRDIVPNIQAQVPIFIGRPTAPGLLTTDTGLRPFPLLGSITTIESDAHSSFHSLQLQLTKKFTRGLRFTASYAWSHAIDEVSDIFDLAGAPALPQNSFDRAAERADANFDVRHRFVYSFVYELPWARDNSVLGGWALSSIGQFQTGQPYTVLFCCDVNLDGNLTDRVSEAPVFGPGGSITGGLGDVGISGRNNFRAPDLYNVDAAVVKTFRFTENQNLEFRTEVFNLFNRSHFGIPVHQLFFGGFGFKPLTEQNNYIDTRLPKRTIQFALKYNF